jgi:hypothetical protein
MILRLSQKLAKKVRVILPREAIPRDPNPYADWSAATFLVSRSQYVILTNTSSLYSTLFPGRGITDESILLDHGFATLRDQLIDDGFGFVFRRWVVPSMSTVVLSKASDRSVIGSMNDLVLHAKYWLEEGESSPFEAAERINDMPMSALKYGRPLESFKRLTSAT